MDRLQLLRFQKLFEKQLNAGAPSARDLDEGDFSEPTDSIDQASLLQEQILSDTLKSRKMISIQGAKAALDRIRKGQFGICEECSEEIDFRRLEIHPTTSYCIQCQEELEHCIGA